jgi:signal transduction histidine kinase
MRQVLTVLASNALESMGTEGGRIRVSTGTVVCTEEHLSASRLEERPQPGVFAFLEVSDTGAGMDEETLARMFDPFFTTKFPGRGLGLSATMGIVLAHQGATTVESEPGEGTRIRVMLPVAAGGRR